MSEEKLENMIQNGRAVIDASPDGFIWCPLDDGFMCDLDRRAELIEKYNSGDTDELNKELLPGAVYATFEEIEGASRSSGGVVKIDPVTGKIVSLHTQDEGTRTYLTAAFGGPHINFFAFNDKKPTEKPTVTIKIEYNAKTGKWNFEGPLLKTQKSDLIKGFLNIHPFAKDSGKTNQQDKYTIELNWYHKTDHAEIVSDNTGNPHYRNILLEGAWAELRSAELKGKL
ncbi:hypothetical protein KY346_06480 [Candidatus Woesearchaeota archaeon]|nr:hypothetical protein [Candidatus Woesearchaeota archaeon]